MSGGAQDNYLPILVRDGGVSEWEREFCASLIAQQRRGHAFSAKQEAVLARIVAAFQRRTMGDDEVLE